MLITGLVVILILLSLSLIVTVPVALGSPNEWETSKRNVYKGIQLWAGLVVLIAAIDGTST